MTALTKNNQSVLGPTGSSASTTMGMNSAFVNPAFLNSSQKEMFQELKEITGMDVTEIQFGFNSKLYLYKFFLHDILLFDVTMHITEGNFLRQYFTSDADGKQIIDFLEKHNKVFKWIDKGTTNDYPNINFLLDEDIIKEQKLFYANRSPKHNLHFSGFSQNLEDTSEEFKFGSYL
jgi:hypothetical protein